MSAHSARHDRVGRQEYRGDHSNGKNHFTILLTRVGPTALSQETDCFMREIVYVEIIKLLLFVLR